MPLPYRLLATAFVHEGALRPANEDVIAVADRIESEPMAAPLQLERPLSPPAICLVADGMGGHAAGEVASRRVAEHLVRHAHALRDADGLRALVETANRELFDLMRAQPLLAGMGSTVAGMWLACKRAIVFNVGDSRAYRIEGSGLVQLSTDDNPGPKLAGGRRAAFTSSALTQALGGAYAYAPVEPHLLEEPLVDGARYLLCSDGLSDPLADDAIAACLGEDDRAGCLALFEAAMAAGGPDNIAIVLLRIERQG